MNHITKTKRLAPQQTPEENPETTPLSKKRCFNRMLNIDSTGNNHLLTGYNECIKDINEFFNTFQLIRAVNTASPETLSMYQNAATKEALELLRNTVDSALTRLFESNDLSNSPPALRPTPPVSPEPFRPLPTTTEPVLPSPPAVTTATEGVVHGTGAVAARELRAGDEICLYDGQMTYRIRSSNRRNSGKYHVFTIRDKGDDNFGLNFLEEDTYVTWSSVLVISTGKQPAIELGRNCQQDIRYMNHSKSANVTICYKGSPVLSWGTKENLELSVIALKDIKAGEELLLDYDPDKPDFEIDFSPSAVKQTNIEIPNSEQKKKITERVNGLNQRFLRPGQETSAGKREKEVNLPPALDNEIGQIIQRTKDIREKKSCPATINEFMEALTQNQKQLLSVIFSTEEPSVEDLAAYIPSRKTRTAQNASITQLTMESAGDLKQYLTRSVFNGKNTWFTARELKENLNYPGR